MFRCSAVRVVLCKDYSLFTTHTYVYLKYSVFSLWFAVCFRIDVGCSCCFRFLPVYSSNSEIENTYCCGSAEMRAGGGHACVYRLIIRGSTPPDPRRRCFLLVVPRVGALSNLLGFCVFVTTFLTSFGESFLGKCLGQGDAHYVPSSLTFSLARGTRGFDTCRAMVVRHKYQAAHSSSLAPSNMVVIVHKLG